MPGRQIYVANPWDGAEYRQAVRATRPHPDAALAQLGLAQTWCDTQRLAKHLVDSGRGRTRIEPRAGLTGRAHHHPAIGPGDDVMSPTGGDDRPRARISLRQPQVDDLAALRFDRNPNPQLIAETRRPGPAGDRDRRSGIRLTFDLNPHHRAISH